MVELMLVDNFSLKVIGVVSDVQHNFLQGLGGKLQPDGTILVSRDRYPQLASHFQTNIPEALLEFKAVNSSTAKDVYQQLPFVLKHYQMDTVDFILGNSRVLLALACGLGKTLCTIASIMILRKTNPTMRTLCVVPSVLKDTWLQECAKWTEWPVIVIKNGKEIPKVNTSNFVVIGYSLLSKHYSAITSKFDVLVGDEAHYLKHIKSARAQAFFNLSQKVNKVILLTATPAETHENLYNLLRILNPVMFRYFHHYQFYTPKTQKFYFADRYCIPEPVFTGRGRKSLVFNKSQRSSELRYICSNCMISFGKEQLSLPPLIKKEVVVGELEVTQKLHVKDKLKEIDKKRKKNKNAADHELMALMREVAVWKEPFVIQQFEETHLADDGPTIVFTASLRLQSTLEEYFLRKGVPTIVINGQVNMKHRTILLHRLSLQKTCSVGLLSLHCCAAGLNLGWAKASIFVETLFDSVILKQAESRVHRLGCGDEPIHLTTFILLGGLDQLLKFSVNKKRKVSDLLLK